VRGAGYLVETSGGDRRFSPSGKDVSMATGLVLMELGKKDGWVCFNERLILDVEEEFNYVERMGG